MTKNTEKNRLNLIEGERYEVEYYEPLTGETRTVTACFNGTNFEYHDAQFEQGDEPALLGYARQNFITGWKKIEKDI